jgi:hypothetical protein
MLRLLFGQTLDGHPEIEFYIKDPAQLFANRVDPIVLEIAIETVSQASLHVDSKPKSTILRLTPFWAKRAVQIYFIPATMVLNTSIIQNIKQYHSASFL